MANAAPTTNHAFLCADLIELSKENANRDAVNGISWEMKSAFPELGRLRERASATRPRPRENETRLPLGAAGKGFP